jgi:hypothetical protein
MHSAIPTTVLPVRIQVFLRCRMMYGRYFTGCS